MSKTIKTGLSEMEKEVRMIMDHIIMIAIFLDLVLMVAELPGRILFVRGFFKNLSYSFGELLI